MGSKELCFKRKERKYLILEYSFEQIKKELEKNIPIQIYRGNESTFGIETTYLDTSDFLLYREYLRQRPFRFKIRLRRYRNDGILDNKYYVELKIKANKVSWKRRFILPGELLEEFLGGENLHNEIKIANQGMPGAQKAYRIISQLIEMNEFVPVLRSSYERMAFQKKTRRVRITVDRNVKHEKLLGEYNQSQLDAVILESKIIGKSPGWHKKMLKMLSLIKQERFSKFTTGINSLYFPERGKYNFYADDEVEELPSELVMAAQVLLEKEFRLKDISQRA